MAQATQMTTMLDAFSNAAIENSRLAIFKISPEGRVLYANPYVCEYMGYTEQQLAEMYIWDFDADYPRERIAEVWQELKRAGTVTINTFHNCATGQKIPVEVNASYIHTSDEEFSFCVVRNMASRLEGDESLVMAHAFFQNTYEGVLITDTENKIVAVNPAFTRITGYSSAEVLGKDPSILSAGEQSPGFYQRLWKKLNSEGYWRGEIKNRKKDGEVYIQSISITAIGRDINGRANKYFALFYDVTKQKERDEAIWRMANLDPLTNIPNRRLFGDRLETAIRFAERRGSRMVLGVLDLNNFKEINDRYGHDLGDALLVELAKRLEATVRSSDTVARMGGDEFLVLFQDIQDDLDEQRLRDTLLKGQCGTVDIEGHPLPISVSVGFSSYPSDGKDFKTLLRVADRDMYRHKAEIKAALKSGYDLCTIGDLWSDSRSLR